MTVRSIRLLGDAVLRTPAATVTSFDAGVRALVTDLLDTLDAEPGRAGVAAPQIGVGLRAFAYDAGGARGCLLNPTIVERDGEQRGDEACLSLPGLAFPTPRSLRVTVEGVDADGEPVTVRGSGFLARALQHETDHLDGVLYVDTLNGAARRDALRAIRARFRAPGR